MKASIRPFWSEKFLPNFRHARTSSFSSKWFVEMRGLFGLSKKISARPTSTFFLDPGLPRWRSCQILSNFLWRGIQKYDFSDYQKYKNLILNFISCFWGYRTELEYDKLKVNGVLHPPAWATAYYAIVVVKLSDFFQF